MDAYHCTTIFDNQDILSLKLVDTSVKDGKTLQEINNVDSFYERNGQLEEQETDINQSFVIQKLGNVPLTPTKLFCNDQCGRHDYRVNESNYNSKTSITKVLQEVKICKKEKQFKFNDCDEPNNLKSSRQLPMPIEKSNLIKGKEASARSVADKVSGDFRKNGSSKKIERFECADCGKLFKEKSHLATHSRAHINIRNFKCSLCDLAFKTKTNLSFHFQTHSDKPFTCSDCNKTFSERKNLNRHKRIVHSSNERYVCDQCGKKFKSSTNLSLHYTLHSGSKPYSCNMCTKTFVYKSTYVSHLKIHQTGQTSKCDSCPDEKSCQHHCEARPWLCTICGKGYPLKGTLKNHMKSHNPEKPFKCYECAKSFMKKMSLECHVKAEHRGERPEFMCDQCSQSYFNVFALKRHYLKHTSERSFRCDTCGKAFWMKDALKVHMKSHTSVKSYPCPHCSRSFVHKHSLNAHIHTHIGTQPFACNVCGKSFVYKYNLSRHEKQHQPSLNIKKASDKVTTDHRLYVK